ncbi:MAG TPA: type I DNA topoisomerase [Spirochaetia bacterium]|nr:type I DNA topoisomerase [Spirochaetia bacterium]
MKEKKLVIVESPAKAKTIEKYLGSGYSVTSCKGHIIDLPKSRFGVDIENNFTPVYITVRGRGKILQELRRAAGKSTEVLLASDDDREGESIAFHLRNAISEKHPDVPISRISFNEITKTAIQESIKHPRDIDNKKVESQKARRILDRIVGYKISPLLWEKVKKGLSAGRVQSVALSIICEREDAINKFISEEYWTLFLVFSKIGFKEEYSARFISRAGKRIKLKSRADVDEILSAINNEKVIISKVEESQRTRKPLAPYITSRMQQDASQRFGFSSSKTMMLAQRLYEGLDIGSERTGLITYMRTDSVRISNQAAEETEKFIKDSWGENYLPEARNIYKSRSGSQDAHEAIRPTSAYRTPESIKKFLEPDEYKLYSLVWERFISSQMKSASFKTQHLEISAGDALFSLAGSKLVFDGFLKALHFLSSDSKELIIPGFSQGEEVDKKRFNPEQHFTMPPPRYTDASLVRFMEESGIGRPSTYAPTIGTLLARYYVQREGRYLKPTVLGNVVNGILKENFRQILNINFTAEMESELDRVENGSFEWQKLLSDFYVNFAKEFELAEKNIQNMKNFMDEETDQVCEKCGAKIIKKLGRFGFFLACSGFPNCRNTKSMPIMKCPVDGCSGDIIAKRSKTKGRPFYGCSRYPECEFVSWTKPAADKCPACGKFMIEKHSKKNGSWVQCSDAECGHRIIKSAGAAPEEAPVEDEV